MTQIEENNKMKKGFSLIEMLVVIFILVLAIGITLASFQDTKPLDEVEAASRGIAALLREAQNSSLTGRQQMGAGVLQSVCNNGVQLSYNDTNRTTSVVNNYILTSPTGCVPLASLANEKTTVFKNVQAAFSDAPTVARILFSTPSGRVEFKTSAGVDVPFDRVKIRIQSTANANIISTVCVYKTGNITDFSGDVAC